MVNYSISFRSPYFYIVILTAFAIQYSIFNKHNSTHKKNELNHHVQSAIKRAKTETCKNELKDFAFKIQHEPTLPALRRTCKFDNQDISRNLKVGCISIESAQNVTKIEELVLDPETCFNLCFSYGHSHAGHHHVSRSCYCGDNSESENIVFDCAQPRYVRDQMDWFKVNHGIYYPKKRPYNQSYSTNSDIRIAFLLTLSGHSTLHIKRLLKNIYSKKHIYLLHVDKRNQKLFHDLVELETQYDNVIVTRKRFETIWGAPSLLSTVLDAIATITSKQSNWHYMINLSESDFPLKPIADLANYLGNQVGSRSIFLKGHNIEGYKFIKKQGLDKIFYQCDQRAWLIGTRKLLNGVIYSGGSDWFALPREFCDYILNNLKHKDTQNNLVGALVQFYNYTILPVESFFHTLASNSEFCDRIVDNNLRLTNWHRKQGCKCQHKDVVDWCGCSPLVYRSSDWERLWLTRTRDDLYFSRKFDPTISSSIIGKVELELLKNRGQTQANPDHEIDSRYWQNFYDLKNVIFSAKNEQVMKEFGLFCIRYLNQTLIASRIDSSLLALHTIDMFFDKDRFIGFVFNYCMKNVCIQFLVERNSYNTKNLCKEIEGNSLYAIEVNHGFDTGERMFRNHLPLDQDSSVVVYHEWLSTNSSLGLYSSSTSGRIRFSWSNEKVGFNRNQKINLKNLTKGTRTTLAHRLNSKPIPSGQWTLRVSIDDRECFAYQFIVFSLTAYSERSISQQEFDRFYSVSQICLSSTDIHNYTLDNCHNHIWSIESKFRWIKLEN